MGFDAVALRYILGTALHTHEIAIVYLILREFYDESCIVSPGDFQVFLVDCGARAVF